MNSPLRMALVAAVSLSGWAMAADWPQFRGPGGLATSKDKGLVANWSEKDNVVWKTDLPGPGGSSPITLGNRIYLTCYSGYGLEPNQGDMKNLRRHVLCLDRKTGKITWQKEFKPELPESTYRGGNSSRHGYSSSTPVTDGERVYVFFGKSGVYCLDLDGKQLWQASVGTRTTGWGSSNSPVLFELTRDHVVTAFATSHTIPSLGFLVWDRRFKLKDEYHGLPGDKIRDLRQSGVQVTREVRVPLLAYTGDTSPAGLDNFPQVYEAKVLITELSFIRPNHRREKIHKFGHMHLDDFIERADRFQNELIICSHFSTRYHTQEVRRVVDAKLPPALRERVKLWM